MKKKIDQILISLGGSLVAPKEGFDTQYLLTFRAFILKQVKAGKRFFIVVGGGNTARRYQDAAKEVGCSEHEELDKIGIVSTYCNAELVRLLFGKQAYPKVIRSYEKAVDLWNYPIVIGSGWKPGFSTDFVLVSVAGLYGGHKIINLSNIDSVYDKDPHKSTDAKKIEIITYDELLAIIGNDWVPGKNAPFDPIACKLAKKMSLEVYVTNGKDFKNLEKMFAGESFKGTRIFK
jgi:uridylate kinase